MFKTLEYTVELMGWIPGDPYLWYITLNTKLNIKLPIGIFDYAVGTIG